MIQEKQFGVWLDTQHATVVTKENTEEANLNYKASNSDLNIQY